ncbi:MAG: response regulator [Hyphomicrobiaceae bacterium]
MHGRWRMEGYMVVVAQKQVDVLVIDDNEAFTMFVGEVAESCGLKAALLTDPTLFKERMEKTGASIVIMDIDMPGVSGLQLSQWLGEFSRAENIEVQLILVSGHREETIRLCKSVAAISGLRDVEALAKPVELAVLTQLLRRLTAK